MEYLEPLKYDADMETVTESVMACIEMFCENQKIDDLRKCPQTVFTACMGFVGRTLFKGGYLEKQEYNSDHGSFVHTKNGRVSERMNAGTDLYIYICRVYDKVATIAGLCEFLGVSRSYFHAASKADGGIDEAEIKEKIFQASEDTASEVLLSGKRQPMAVLPYLNHFHGWTRDISPQGKEENNNTVALPDLSGFLTEDNDE